MATLAWTQTGSQLNARLIPVNEWEQLTADVRASAVILHCENCQTPLRTRNQSIDGRTKHFLHPAGSPDSCPNREQEGESDYHRELKSVVASAFESVKGIQVVEEYQATDPDGRPIRVDVAVLDGLVPRSLAEIQTSYADVVELNRRDLQRRRTVTSAAGQGWAYTTPWFTPRAHDATYRRFPYLYLTSDGQRVTDGIHPFRGGMGTNEDDPIDHDIDKVAALLLNGNLIQVDTWWADRSDTVGRRGKRRRKAPVLSTADRLCDRTPAEPLPAEPPRPMATLTPRPRQQFCKLCGSGAPTFPTRLRWIESGAWRFPSWGYACEPCRAELPADQTDDTR